MNAHMTNWIRLGALGLGLALAAACSDDNNAVPDSPTIRLPDSPTGGGTADSPAATHDAPATGTPDAPASSTCFTGTPTTSEELLNACTTAQQIDRNPTLPLYTNPGGPLPAHP